MKIAYNRSTLHHFPPPGRRWKWGDVVGQAEGMVDPEEAHVVAGYLTHHDDGRYSVDERLAEYLDDQHSITLDGSVTDPQQDTLPGGVEPEASPGAVDVITGDDGDDDPVKALATVPGKQVSLDGERVHAEQLAAAVTSGVDNRTTRRRVRAAHTRSTRAENDTCQTELTAFDTARVTGRLDRRSGTVYSGPDPKLKSARQVMTMLD